MSIHHHPFAFQHLKTYASDECMAHGTKKYASVFDWEDICYCWVELAFLNKRVSEQAWAAHIVLKIWDCTDATPVLLGSIEHNRTIEPSEATFIERGKWGDALQGTAFKVGKYRWTAWINGLEVGKVDFFINGVGSVSTTENPYFDINDLQIYTGKDNAWNQPNKLFLKQIDKKTTQYIWLQFSFRNKTSRAWRYEMYFHIRDHKGELKGTVVKTGEISANKKFVSYNFDIAWGNEIIGNFEGELYVVEVIFMDFCIASACIPTGNQAIEGKVFWQKGRFIPILNDADSAIDTPPASLAELMAELDALIGLQGIKKAVQQHLTYTRFVQLRQSKGLEKHTAFKLHAVFTGNPGTGKTTVIKQLGQIYQTMGLLSKGHIYKADRADLIGEYIGHTAPKVKKVLEEARGGILFVDEAYALLRDETDVKDFGREALEILMMEMSDGEGDIAIVFAGYPREIHKLLHANPGLKSRFQHFYHFEDYEVPALMEIALNYASSQDLQLHYTAKNQLQEKIQNAYNQRDGSFGNARFAKQLIDDAKVQMASRIMQNKKASSLTIKQLSLMLAQDFL